MIEAFNETVINFLPILQTRLTKQETIAEDISSITSSESSKDSKSSHDVKVIKK